MTVCFLLRYRASRLWLDFSSLSYRRKLELLRVGPDCSGESNTITSIGLLVVSVGQPHTVKAL